MLTNFCSKCGKFICTCVVTASIAGQLFGFATVDVQGDLPSDHAVGALMSGTTGPTGMASQTLVIYNEITDQEYVVARPDQRRIGVLGPTGPAAEKLKVEVRLTGPTGPAVSGTGVEFPKGPTGATG